LFSLTSRRRLPPALITTQVAWALLVAALWVGGLLTLPLDPDYTAGELLDQALSWRGTGALYTNPAIAPYHVLNYPPVFLELVRALAATGVPTLLAGRLLGSAGVCIALVVLWQWMRDEGLDAKTALGITALAACSFPMLYSAGQFHLEGLAVAAMMGGFWLAPRRGIATGLLAGALLAAACLVKQSQVVLSLVALLWVWRYRGRDGWPVLAAYVTVGVIGCISITVGFGPEAWRQMLTDTVGTFSVAQLWGQLVPFALPWTIFAIVALRFALGTAKRRRDIRCWYLVGTTVWMFSAARVGAGYTYFIDWELAILLWIGALAQAWAKAAPAHEGWRQRATMTALTAQIVIANVVVAGVLVYDLRTTQDVAVVLPVLCPHIPHAPILTPTESLGLVRACGGRPALDPFIIANLTARGLWDETPFVHALEAGRYPVLVLPFDPRVGPNGLQQARERWTPQVVAAMAKRYRPLVQAGGWWVLVPGS
jgi:hypothetical protein